MNTDIIFNGLVSAILAIIGYLTGRRQERAKVGQQDMETVKLANEMIAPLLTSSEELANKVKELRIENETSRKEFSVKIGELEKKVHQFKLLAQECTCGAFTNQNTT